MGIAQEGHSERGRERERARIKKLEHGDWHQAPTRPRLLKQESISSTVIVVNCSVVDVVVGRM